MPQVKFYDLGGGKKIRSIWDKYYHDAHALLYVVDGTDADRWQESKEQFSTATRHKYLQGKVSIEQFFLKHPFITVLMVSDGCEDADDDSLALS